MTDSQVATLLTLLERIVVALERVPLTVTDGPRPASYSIGPSPWTCGGLAGTAPSYYTGVQDAGSNTCDASPTLACHTTHHGS
jgi:hypothetical protein